jgi:hypothetical protein
VALGTSPFSDQWHTHHRPTLNATMTARVKIERVISEGKYDMATGDYTGGETELLYLGRANIDRIARPTRRDFVSDAADNQMTQVQLPISDALNEADPRPVHLRWQSNDVLTILENEALAMMVGELVFLRGWFGASEDWGHTLHFGFNSKQGIA